MTTRSIVQTKMADVAECFDFLTSLAGDISCNEHEENYVEKCAQFETKFHELKTKHSELLDELPDEQKTVYTKQYNSQLNLLSAFKNSISASREHVAISRINAEKSNQEQQQQKQQQEQQQKQQQEQQQQHQRQVDVEMEIIREELALEQERFEQKEHQQRREFYMQQKQKELELKRRSLISWPTSRLVTSSLETGSFEQTSNENTENSMEKLIKHIRKPTFEIDKFDGDSLKFVKFIRQFKLNILPFCESNAERIALLEQYTTGQANKIVSAYLHLSDKLAFESAMKKLEERFGNKQLIAQTFISRALDWPQIKADDSIGLDSFSLFLNEIASAIQELKEVQILEYPQNLQRLVSKLPVYCHEKWRSIVYRKSELNEYVTFNDLTKFVECEAKKANDPLYGRLAFGSLKGSTNNHATIRKASFATNESENKTKRRGCQFCQKDNHSLAVCFHFGKKSMEEKREFIKTKKLCFKCLKAGHLASDCKSVISCKTCNGKHATVMHRETNTKTREQSEPTTVASSNHLKTNQNEFCTLAIVPVKLSLKGKVGEIKTYAFIDPGSTVSFVRADLAESLGASGKKKFITIETMGKSQRNLSQIINGLKISNLDSQSSSVMNNVFTIKNIPISRDHIVQNSDIMRFQHLQGINLPQIDGPIGMLIGNNTKGILTPHEVRTGPKNTPYAIKCDLGWVVYNLTRKNQGNVAKVHRISVTNVSEINNGELENMYRESLNMDFPEKAVEEKREFSQHDKIFMQKISNSIKKVGGHYELELPFKEDKVHLPDNKKQSEYRLALLKQKLVSDKRLHGQYIDFMTALLSQGHAEKVPKNEIARKDGKVHYIPHFGTYHPKKPDKLRVVFDCSARCQGESINDKLLQGPNLTNDLIGVLLRFREGKIALMADVESMFYQVQVPKKDRDCLRFLWWENGDYDKEPEVYRMCVHLFGATSSPSCAISALNQTAYDNAEQYNEETVSSVLRHFYVDDLLRSISTEDKAIELVRDLISLCELGGFKLTKWVSNSRAVLNSIPEEKQAKSIKSLDLKKDQLPIERTLGVFWSAETDSFCFEISLPVKPITRRGILATTSSIYDPLGFASPFILPAKIILQELCRKGYDWDERLPDQELKNWQKWLLEIKEIESLKIPRFLRVQNDSKQNIQMHIFCDASELAYGVAIYLRVQSHSTQCSLVMAKSRVAPIKKQSIVRLELTACMVGVKLANLVKNEMDIKLDSVHYWTDSTAVLKYIANDRTRFHTFVANRINVIRECTKVGQWHYVNTKENPADIASRGLSSCDKRVETWIKGPDFLYGTEGQWSNLEHEISLTLPENDPEVKCLATTVENGDTEMELFGKFPWKKLVRVYAWVLKFIFNVKSKISQRKLGQSTQSTVQSHTGELTVEEIENTKLFIFRWVQWHYFTEEILRMKEGKTIKGSSSIIGLAPIYEDHLIKVGGRLDKSGLGYESKHPIILPKSSIVSKRMVDNAHKEVGHMGKNSMVAHLRQRYWIIGLPGLALKVARNCITCRKYNANTMSQQMGDLPADRVTGDVPAFSSCGVDYMGPVEVKLKRSRVKRWLVVFICLASRAIHLEVASSLDTNSCINAIRRFMCRRGQVVLIRSDNRTNFIGSNNEFRAEFEKIDRSSIHNFCANKGITWEFNPPGASHFGGVWERMIRTIRKIMYSLLKEQNNKFDDEGLNTLCCEIENIINCRPITEISNTPNDLSFLTPNHLLLAREGAGVPPGIFDKNDNYYRKQWKQVQYIVEKFWTKWSKEYLTTLQERQKWKAPRRNVQIDDIVLLVENKPRNSWALGRVVEVLKDRKDLVRIVRVQTNNKIVERSVHKLCLILEGDE